MYRSWLVWFGSVIAFFLTVILVVTFGPAQEYSAQDANSWAKSAELPEMVSSGQNPLVPNPLNSGQTDFTINPSFQGSSQELAQMPSTLDTMTQPSQEIAESLTNYHPREIVQLADPSNYGARVAQDVNGNAVSNEYIVVLHETVGSAMSAVNTFQTPHPRDEDQVSYHTLIAEDGTVVYVVPPEQRAFGAGDSVFRSLKGEEAVFTNAEFPSSVNNFAYHISLETPSDGRNNNAATHSGYTEAQYQSLAWLLGQTNIPDQRITTHEAVDRSGSRIDPRSFDSERLFELLHQYPSRQALR
jgi:N-acetyl-anhydromuramyl-L-alanine amidase AmpD